MCLARFSSRGVTDAWLSVRYKPFRKLPSRLTNLQRHRCSIVIAEQRNIVNQACQVNRSIDFML